jgi:hypothetical protein
MRAPARRLLLAGSWGPERMPARPDRDNADWYLPLHVRDERGARERIAAQVVAGADVVVAPTWLTHRRALLPLGETRRATAWTTAAVRVAREAIELGLERREELFAEATEDDVRRGRPRPFLAASLPALDEESEPGTGRLLPHDAATERDYRDQAGVLSDAEPDLLLVEGQSSEAEARTAIAEATDTGLPVWAALTRDAIATSGVEAWLEWSRHAGLAHILLPGPVTDAAIAADGDLPWGGTVGEVAETPDWLAAGATVIARTDGAAVATLEPLRNAIDDHEREAIATAHARDRRWAEHVTAAATAAPGGAAVWLGQAPTAPLPDGFEWLVVKTAEARRLPSDHYRLVIVDGDAVPDPGCLVQRGGVLVLRLEVVSLHVQGLRLISLDDQTRPPLATYRRED